MLGLDEQEVTINLLRTDEMAEIYCSDTTWINKLNKLCEASPDLYKKIKETENGCTYRFPKKLVSLRKTIVTRDLTDKQREAMVERARQMGLNRAANKNS